jgi:tripartite-type tricarboxylate transporter receptor subunit TctC
VAQIKLFRLAQPAPRSAIAALALLAFSFIPAAAQIAGRPVTIIVPYTPGTGIDILARALGAELAKQ